MLRSLVGSEMCIRDRHGIHGAHPWPSVQGTGTARCTQTDFSAYYIQIVLYCCVVQHYSHAVDDDADGLCAETVSAGVRRRCSSTCRAVTTSSRCCTSTSSLRSPATPRRRRPLPLRPRCRRSPVARRRFAPIQTSTTSSKLSSAQLLQRRQRPQPDKAAVSLASLSFKSDISAVMSSLHPFLIPTT